jgi:four helix bundle protein
MSVDAKKAEELERRFVLFAAQIVAVSSKMPRTSQGRHISMQILRSGTATASNYGEARGAESRTDFVHKLKIVLKELNETSVWLQLIRETSLLSADKVIPIIAENAELRRIIFVHFVHFVHLSSVSNLNLKNGRIGPVDEWTNPHQANRFEIRNSKLDGNSKSARD